MTDSLIHEADQRALKREYDRARYLRVRADRLANRPPDPIAELVDTELAYLAGLTDADGSIYVTHTNRLRTYYPAVSWAMVDKPTIEWVAVILGGTNVVLNNHTSLRRGTTSWGQSKFREQWRTAVTGSRAALLCNRMQRFMHTKRRQAELVAAFPVDERRAPRVLLSDEVRTQREALAKEISDLNRGR